MRFISTYLVPRHVIGGLVFLLLSQSAAHLLRRRKLPLFSERSPILPELLSLM